MMGMTPERLAELKSKNHAAKPLLDELIAALEAETTRANKAEMYLDAATTAKDVYRQSRGEFKADHDHWKKRAIALEQVVRSLKADEAPNSLCALCIYKDRHHTDCKSAGCTDGGFACWTLNMARFTGKDGKNE
jgi:hypothetical protein